MSRRLILSPGTGAEAGAAAASATRPGSVIRRIPTLWFLDRAVSVVSANPTRTRLSTISPEKPCAVISALVAPTRLANISSARRHWGLRDISRLTQAARGNLPLWRQLPVKRNCTEVRLNPNSNYSFVRGGRGIPCREQKRDDKLADRDQKRGGLLAKGREDGTERRPLPRSQSWWVARKCPTRLACKKFRPVLHNGLCKPCHGVQRTLRLARETGWGHSRCRLLISLRSPCGRRQ